VRTSNLAPAICAVCERSLLMGERATRFAPEGSDLVDVCPLCQDAALEHGWVREGSPSVPTMRPERRRRRLSLGAIFEQRRPEVIPVAPAPTNSHRLTRVETALVEAADIFNGSPFRRTVAGIAKSLGPPEASIVQLSGVNKEVVVTVAWEISWYQYRVSLDSIQPVRLAERGLELDDLDVSFRRWNAHVDGEGRLVPDAVRG